jgi:hypothetical protein
MKKTRSERKRERQWFGDRVAAPILSVFILATVAVAIVVVWHKSTVPVDAGDYEGTIVDRWADYAESDQGSRPRLALVIESRDHKRLTVRVDPTVYESARVGMRIKSRAGQIVLIEPQPKSPDR